MIALAWGEQGFRHLTNNASRQRAGRYDRPEDPHHGKPGAHHRVRHAGRRPTPMAWPEVIGALQQGTIDGQENPLSVIIQPNCRKCRST